MKMIISISQHRLLHVYAEIDQEQCVAPSDGLLAIGRIVRDVKDVWTRSDGRVLIDSAGCLWVDYKVDGIPLKYLARDAGSFQRAAELNNAASKLEFLPRSQQWKYDEADQAFINWLRENDPQAIEDVGSYWNELRTTDF